MSALRPCKTLQAGKETPASREGRPAIFIRLYLLRDTPTHFTRHALRYANQAYDE